MGYGNAVFFLYQLDDAGEALPGVRELLVDILFTRRRDCISAKGNDGFFH
jgi:hypothetical protein